MESFILASLIKEIHFLFLLLIYLFSQELENCYKILISQEKPYATAKFRTKVNENTPTYELLIHRQATMDNINRDKRNWTKEIENMDTKI